MASPDPERALEDETPAQPGARADEPRGGDDEDFWKVAGEAVGQPAGGGETRQQALEPPADGLAAERAHADVQEVALREVPAVALEVGLGDELGPTVAGRERAQALGADARLALLRHDHVLLAARAPEPTRDRAAVPARADHDPGMDGAGVARD